MSPTPPEQAAQPAGGEIVTAEATELAVEASPPAGLDLLDWYAYRVSCIEWARQTAKARCQAIVTQCDRERAWLEGTWGAAFERAVAREIERQPGKARSVQLGCARAGYRRTPGALVIEDEHRLLDEVARRPELADLVRVEERRIISKTAVREWVKSTGEELPGCRIEPPGDRFYVQADLTALAAGDAGDSRAAEAAAHGG